MYIIGHGTLEIKELQHLQSPIHKYTKAGKYTVSLTVKNAAGSSTKTMTITVK